MRVSFYPISEDLLRNVHVDVLGLDLYAAADGGGVGDGADGALQPRLGQVVRLGLPEPDGAHGDRGDAAVNVTVPSAQTEGVNNVKQAVNCLACGSDECVQRQDNSGFV